MKFEHIIRAPRGGTPFFHLSGTRQHSCRRGHRDGRSIVRWKLILRATHISSLLRERSSGRKARAASYPPLRVAACWQRALELGLFRSFMGSTLEPRTCFLRVRISHWSGRAMFPALDRGKPLAPLDAAISRVRQGRQDVTQCGWPQWRVGGRYVSA